MTQMFQRGNRWVNKAEAIAMDEADKLATKEALALQVAADEAMALEDDVQGDSEEVVEESVDESVEEVADEAATEEVVEGEQVKEPKQKSKGSTGKK